MSIEAVSALDRARWAALVSPAGSPGGRRLLRHDDAGDVRLGDPGTRQHQASGEAEGRNRVYGPSHCCPLAVGIDTGRTQFPAATTDISSSVC